MHLSEGVPKVTLYQNKFVVANIKATLRDKKNVSKRAIHL